MRSISRPGAVSVEKRSTLRKCSLPGIRPSTAMCGRLARQIRAPIDSATPITTPASTPNASKAAASARS